jgi:glycosyltransferase involved in cell wall biosynthesis
VTIVQLAASPFLGGPERQLLGLASALPDECRTVFLSFAEGGRCQALLDEARRQGFEAVALQSNAPRWFRAAAEIADHVRRVEADVLCCNGYKPDIIGWLAARRAGVPVVSISHGWTGATLKVRLNEALDRLVLQWMDATVCVSEAQADRVRSAGISPAKIAVIRNAVQVEAFAQPDPKYRAEMHGWFARRPAWIVGAAGRLSPEKGLEQFVEAAALVRDALPGAGFVLFGDGPRRAAIERGIVARGLEGYFVLAGFRTDVQAFLPWLDVAVLSSHVEGLPVFVLEAMAAGVPVVATAVGGTPEAVVEGVTGHLVPPGDPPRLAECVRGLLGDEARRRSFGERGRQRVAEQFTFAAQSAAYLRLFEKLIGRAVGGPRGLDPRYVSSALARRTTERSIDRRELA